MKLTFLGGADEIGASCSLLEVGESKILIDAGLRHHERSGERIPAFSEIGSKLDAIILTHAHLDHTGALPVVAATFPNTPIYLTQPTLAIVSVLLLDSLKIMEMGLAADGEVPIYSLPQIDCALSACRPVAFNTPVKVNSDIEITFSPAGHILGAASVVINTGEGSIVMSGDVYGSDQITVPALTIPYQKPDLFVIESTYGGKQHVSRALEEKRLIDRLKVVTENKGSVIIPAFAVGRSQELILLVSRAIEQGLLPKVPIYVDGMVKNVCAIYSSFPYLTTKWLQRRIKDRGNPFFSSDSLVTPVYDHKTRKDIANLRPAIIISSSGMVTVGSPSSFYASELAKDPRCLIAISGYQDEESPGRRMLELAEQGGGVLPTANGEVNLSCAIEKYSFSAHSDAYQIASELQASQPRRIVLVHGDGGAREAMAKHLSNLGFKDIHLPNLGGEIEIAGKKEKRSQVVFTDKNLAVTAINQDKEVIEEFLEEIVGQETFSLVGDGNLQPEHLEPLAEKLLARDSTSRAYTLSELLVMAGYKPHQITTAEMGRIKIMLKAKTSPFSQDKNNKLVWRLRVLPGNRIATKSSLLPEAEVSKIVRQRFAAEPGLYKVGINKSSRSITVRFYFPKIAISHHKQTLEEITKETGWLVEISPSVHQEELSKTALATIPEGWQPQSVSIMLDRELVIVKVLHGDSRLFDDIDRKFQEKTGFRLEIQNPNVISVTTNTTEATASNKVIQRLEINAAYTRIKEAFSNQPHQLLKVGLKGETIELTFITPEIGKLYEEMLNKLSEEIGYALQVRQSPDQIKLQQTAKEILSRKYNLIGEPSVNLARHEITVKLSSNNTDSNSILELKKQFYSLTGWELLVKIT
ncbi:MAG: MBL fold metallo-hydrolase [Blastocatellia bacterium]|nr:MBL fold metallo-hydrolase [Blastocatellia bacterium]